MWMSSKGCQPRPYLFRRVVTQSPLSFRMSLKRYLAEGVLPASSLGALGVGASISCPCLVLRVVCRVSPGPLRSRSQSRSRDRWGRDRHSIRGLLPMMLAEPGRVRGGRPRLARNHGLLFPLRAATPAKFMYDSLHNGARDTSLDQARTVGDSSLEVEAPIVPQRQDHREQWSDG
jgi:hypothetical protein